MVNLKLNLIVLIILHIFFQKNICAMQSNVKLDNRLKEITLEEEYLNCKTEEIHLLNEAFKWCINQRLSGIPYGGQNFTESYIKKCKDIMQEEANYRYHQCCGYAKGRWTARKQL